MPLFYVQGGITNLILSAYLLFLLGTSVENKVGPFHFLAIFVLPSLLGDLISLMFGTHAGWVMGVNGGVAAVFVFFLFAFPRKKHFWRFANFQAGYSIFVWFLFQFYFGMPFNNWFTGFFYSAHVGGAFCGWAYWYFMRTKMGLKREPEEGLLVPEEKILKAG
jgi:membrane associated rhomboid family serine protease